ncbi:MAG TPA: exonuclease domain-containing protein, partial [Rhodocyclaceae bacterium]|nr:exonuclease domain-containing protein [Rhodocyclaceae bacterium]
NAEGRILLYNNRARLQFKALSAGPTSTTGGALIGLGRSIFSILERHQIEHALEVVRQRQAAGKAALANFITSTRGGQLLRAQLVPVAAGQGDAGYVLTIENITRSLEQEAERDQVLHALTEGSRGALGNIRAAATNLNDYPEMEPALRQRFLSVIAEEAEGMSQRLDRTLHEFADSLQSRWPLEDVLAIDIVAAAARRIEERLALPTKLEALDDSLWIRVDSYSLVLAMAFLAARLKDHYEIRELRFRLLAEGKFAYLDLIWAGSNVSSETFYTWELEPMQVGAESTALTLRDVINRHGGEIWYQREKVAHRAYCRFVLPIAVPEAITPDQARDEGRPEYYDFDLFHHRDASVDLDRPLSELAYTVFDTETTGLEPSAGDEIIQIGAVRIVNQRLLRQERFEQLIDPQRALRAESVAIHGITADMRRGQPVIASVLPAFHAFCEDTVLIAHNAAFDMRFLQLKEEATGIRFGQPVLDTLLLSAVVHPNQESHRLDAIAERLGVSILARHNALDDALATGEVFLKLLPLLADMGIVTLCQALAAAEKTYYARIQY